MAFTLPTSFSAANLTLTLLTVIVSAAFSVYRWRQRWEAAESRVRGLEKSLSSALEKCAAERQGRIRTQQALRKALAQPRSDDLEHASYPLRPIGFLQSCFSTRNGTPRQPLVVSLARAYLNFSPALVPPASLEGLGEYSHCWILYIFHLNTDLEKLWRDPSKSKLKAKVRVPRLKGGKTGVFATRSPHRPNPIGLTVAKVEAIQGHRVLLSGVDLVDGTPVLDIKPYLPYCDNIKEAVVPTWVKDDGMLRVASVGFSDSFSASIADCWKRNEKKSLYTSLDEFRSLIKQVLAWDIRSLSQRNRPHETLNSQGNSNINISDEKTSDLDDYSAEESFFQCDNNSVRHSLDVIYHLVLEGVDVSYRIDSDSNIIVENASLTSENARSKRN